MSIMSLKSYLDTREKYMDFFKQLDQEGIPRDVKGYILTFINNNVETYNLFDKDINNIMMQLKYNKYKLSIDSYHIINYLIYIFIQKTIRDANTVMQHVRRKTLMADDLDYALGIYPQNPSKLINKMKIAGQETTDINEPREPITNTNLVDTVVRDYNIDLANSKRSHNYKARISKPVFSYLAAALDVLVTEILKSVKKNRNTKLITADDILLALENNNDLRTIFLELFI